MKLTEALEILGRAEAEAERQRVSMSLAVVDAADGMAAGATSFAAAAAEFTGGRFLAAAGGYPIVREGAIVGAVGTSGGTHEQDIAVARAALGDT